MVVKSGSKIFFVFYFRWEDGLDHKHQPLLQDSCLGSGFNHKDGKETAFYIDLDCKCPLGFECLNLPDSSRERLRSKLDEGRLEWRPNCMKIPFGVRACSQ